MVRTQISLEPEQMDRLRALAEERGTSLAALVRSAVDALLAQDEMVDIRRRAREAARNSRFRSGFTDIAENHDKYLAEDLMH